jgi:membrane fusion protein (multidrug efflux system)
MNKKTAYLASAGAASALAIAAACVIALPAQSGTPAADPQPSALVTLQPIQLKAMQAMLVAYGDVLPGRLQSISSATPAQLQRLDVVQGQAVRKGQALALLDADPATRLAYEQAKSAQHLAHAELQRVSSMARLQLATQSQVDLASKAVADADAALAAQLALGGGAGMQTVKAPADGVIVALNAMQGDRVQAAAPLMQFGTSDQLKVLLGIDPAERAKVTRGAAVALTSLGASNDSSAPPIRVSVSEVQAQIDPKTQLLNVLVKLPAGSNLLAGSRVRAEIALAAQNAFEVPRQAVLSDASGSYVFQQVQQRAHRVPVRLVTDGQRTVGVISVGTTGNAIDPAKPVVVSGNYELQEGMLLRETR